MPNVLMMTQRYKPHIGGVERHIEQLSHYLREKDYNVTVLTTRDDNSIPECETDGSATIIRFPSAIQRDPFRLTRWFSTKKQVLRNHQVLHCHDFLPILLWTPPFRTALPGRPVFATYHGYERDPVPPEFRILRKVSERLVKGSICIGSFIREVYGTHCSQSPLGAVRSTTERATGHNHAVYVGRLEEDTPILPYIHALEHLTDRYNMHFTLTACGDGTLKEELEEYTSAKGIAARFLGSVADPTECYLQAEIALAGGFLSILEAMSYGLPVVAYSGTTLKNQYYRSVLDAGGRISIQCSAEGVAREIWRLKTSRALYESVSEQAVDFAEENDWERLAGLYVKLWRGSSS